MALALMQPWMLPLLAEEDNFGGVRLAITLRGI